jgi:error-prone DNA polymerase
VPSAATGCWELSEVRRTWLDGGTAAVSDLVNAPVAADGTEPVRRRVLVHSSGFRQSPYADIKPAGVDPSKPPSKLWHSSPGSSGW